jgi:hypothetical protein
MRKFSAAAVGKRIFTPLPLTQSWACCTEERKSQDHKFFVVVLQRKLRFSKAQLHSLRFKLLDATFITGFGMVKLI